MKFFSGFSLKDDQRFFEPLLKKTDYTVAGFSYGAIKALEHTESLLGSSKRVDTLQLFSPAFFQTRSPQFQKLQLRGYQKDEELYLKNFIKACFAPYEPEQISHTSHTLEQLQELLTYKWNLDTLSVISSKGVRIEVYLGSEDSIIDAQGAREFFKEVATVTLFNGANHFLQRKGEENE
jgi:surfactin synthase thioesterase subunit